MQHDMPLLGGIAAIIRWLEELTVLVSGPLLTIGLGIGIYDLLTGGNALQTTPMLAWAWAVSQAIGIEGQLTGYAFGVGRMARARRYWATAGYIALTALLAYVAFLAAQAFTLHESQGVSAPQALAYIGIDTVSWAWQRAGITVVLVILSALLRYTAPKTVAIDEATRLREEIELTPLRAQAQAAKMLGVRSVVQAAVKGVAAPPSRPVQPMAVQSAMPDNETPWGPVPWGAPLTPPAGFVAPTTSLRLLANPATNPPAPAPTRRRTKSSPNRRPRGASSWETSARVAWESGARTVGQMERAVTGISHTAAQYWVGVLKGEARGAQSVRQEA